VVDTLDADVPAQMKAALPRCRRCGSVTVERLSVLDTRKGRTMRIFQCGCGEQIWLEDR
jgi:hypothetical protein